MDVGKTAEFVEGVRARANSTRVQFNFLFTIFVGVVMLNIIINYR